VRTDASADVATDGRCTSLLGTPQDEGGRLASRLAVADAIEAGLDVGEAGVDERLELGVGEDVGPIVLDALTHEVADIERVDAGVDALTDAAQPDRQLAARAELADHRDGVGIAVLQVAHRA